jgi:hypothetical protein
MTPDEIRACYRLYAAHRKSREICTFPGTIPVTSKAGDRDDLARPSPGLSVTCERRSHRSVGFWDNELM